MMDVVFVCYVPGDAMRGLFRRYSINAALGASDQSNLCSASRELLHQRQSQSGSTAGDRDSHAM
jgi:hypothetical protein